MKGRNVLCAATITLGLVLGSPEAGAAWDKHVPQPDIGYCPGGGSGGFGNQWCDGVDFPDGTFIHTSHGFIPFQGWTTTVYCASSHDIIPERAGLNGCGGLL